MPDSPFLKRMPGRSGRGPGGDSAGSSLVRIRDAARGLFIRDGYHKTRPQDIARAAGVAQGTFYLHFTDKREAFLDFAERAQAELHGYLVQQLDQMPGGDRWDAALRAVLDFSGDNPGLLHAAFFDPLLIAPDHPDAWRLHDRMGQLVSLVGGDTGSLERHDAALLSHAICGMLREALIYGARNRMGRDELVLQLVPMIRRVLAKGSGENSGMHKPVVDSGTGIAS